MVFPLGYFSLSIVRVATVHIATSPLGTQVISDVKGNLNDKGDEDTDDEVKKTTLQVEFEIPPVFEYAQFVHESHNQTGNIVFQ